MFRSEAAFKIQREAGSRLIPVVESEVFDADCLHDLEEEGSCLEKTAKVARKYLEERGPMNLLSSASWRQP
jgi:hypothetical protein